jgi:hypothetical protein
VVVVSARKACFADGFFFVSFFVFFPRKLWNDIILPGGVDKFVEWLVLILCDRMVEKFEAYPDTIFLRSDAVKTLHSLLNVQESYNVGFQEFFDTMQQVAEARKLMSVNVAELDDVVPVVVVEQFIREFITGFMKILTEIGFDDQDPIDLSVVGDED